MEENSLQPNTMVVHMAPSKGDVVVLHLDDKERKV